LVLLSWALGLIFYPQMPERVASHWNFRGEVDGHMSRFWGVFLLPSILSGLALLFIVIPRIDPLKMNIDDFRKHFDTFIIIVFGFLLVLYLDVILWNLGIEISPNLILPFALGILWFDVGILLGHTKRNWSIGIRTPWTLSSDMVWKKTHQLSAKLFKICAAIAVVGVLFRDYAWIFVLAPVIITAGYVIFYSYSEYQKEARHP